MPVINHPYNSPFTYTDFILFFQHDTTLDNMICMGLPAEGINDV